MQENFNNNEQINQPAKNILSNINNLIKLDAEFDTIATSTQLDEQVEKVSKAIDFTEEKNKSTVKAILGTLSNLESMAQSFKTNHKGKEALSKIYIMKDLLYREYPEIYAEDMINKVDTFMVDANKTVSKMFSSPNKSTFTKEAEEVRPPSDSSTKGIKEPLTNEYTIDSPAVEVFIERNSVKNDSEDLIIKHSTKQDILNTTGLNNSAPNKKLHIDTKNSKSFHQNSTKPLSKSAQ